MSQLGKAGAYFQLACRKSAENRKLYGPRPKVERFKPVTQSQVDVIRGYSPGHSVRAAAMRAGLI